MGSPIERVTRVQRVDEKAYEPPFPSSPSEPISDENKLVSEVGLSHLPKKSEE